MLIVDVFHKTWSSTLTHKLLYYKESTYSNRTKFILRFWQKYLF